jgi:hypothetical protein
MIVQMISLKMETYLQMSMSLSTRVMFLMNNKSILLIKTTNKWQNPIIG